MQIRSIPVNEVKGMFEEFLSKTPEQCGTMNLTISNAIGREIAKDRNIYYMVEGSWQEMHSRLKRQEDETPGKQNKMMVALVVIRKNNLEQDARDLGDMIKVLKSPKFAHMKTVVIPIGIMGYGINHQITLIKQGQKYSLLDQFGSGSYEEAKQAIVYALDDAFVPIEDIYYNKKSICDNRLDCAAFSVFLQDFALKDDNVAMYVKGLEGRNEKFCFGLNLYSKFLKTNV